MAGTIHNLSAQETFCRFEFGSKIQYGKVEKNQVIPLDKAPWENGKPSGSAIDINKVKFLHPSEPQVILGIGKPYSKGTDPSQRYQTVRWFVKPPSSAGSPDEKVVLPELIDNVKGEVELVIVIGKSVKNADEKEAGNAIFGYSLGNDIVGDVKSFHKRQGEPDDLPEGLLAPGLKSGDNFAPYGPFICTGIDWEGRKKELVITDKNGVELTRYEETTSNMAYSPKKIVSDLSKIMTLSPGDVIFGGTGKAFLVKPGEKIAISIEGIGSLCNEVVK